MNLELLKLSSWDFLPIIQKPIFAKSLNDVRGLSMTQKKRDSSVEGKKEDNGVINEWDPGG